MESIDDFVVRSLDEWRRAGDPAATLAPHAESDLLRRYFDAQLQSRHLDLALRWLQEAGDGFYTIGSAGHESNAAVALALRPTDPALLHYRSGGFYAARAGQVPGSSPILDVLLGATASVRDQISGGRHKVFGNRRLNVIPQTSTIGSHLPRALGLAFAMGRWGPGPGTPEDAVVVCSFGDAAANHSTVTGALNAAGYCAHQGFPLRLLFVCEDNGFGISTRTPADWIERTLDSRPGLLYEAVDGADPIAALSVAARVAQRVRSERTPAILHLKVVRFMGHAGSDAEIAYRSEQEIVADYARDPLLRTAAALVDAGVPPGELLDRYQQVRAEVMDQARALVGSVVRLDSAAAVMRPLARPAQGASGEVAPVTTGRDVLFRGRLPERVPGGLTLAQSLRATLTDLLHAVEEAVVFGEDVAVKGGVYGVTRGLLRSFGARRVFDTLLDEQTILGTALGAALVGRLPIPEIQYLAYLHNAEDQLRGEAATLAFFSDGQYRNGMVVRVAGLAYQKGFGGHFHNDNSVAVLRDIPGLVVAVASGPASGPALLRRCVALARTSGQVCVFLEPIALYHERDLTPGDGRFLAPYPPPGEQLPEDRGSDCGRARLVADGREVIIVTFGNGVLMSQRARERLLTLGLEVAILDLQWLLPLPVDDLLAQAERFAAVLVADETRRSGGVAETVVASLVDGGYPGRIVRLNSQDSIVPLGPAAATVLLSEADIFSAALGLAQSTRRS